MHIRVSLCLARSEKTKSEVSKNYGTDLEVRDTLGRFLSGSSVTEPRY